MADDNIQLRMDLVKMARDILVEEYINKRAEDHNTWLALSEQAWRMNKVKLPYPAFAKYPTDEDIVARALTLYNFVNPIKESETEELSEPVISDIEKTPPVIPESPVVQPDIPLPVLEDKIFEDETSYSKKLLPGWIRRTTGI